MKLKSILSILMLTVAFLTNAQKKVALEKVNAGNQIKGEPYIMLPKAAVKMNMSLAEFTYTAGDSLDKFITITKVCDDKDLKKELKPLQEKYGVNLDAIIGLLKKKKAGEDEFTVMKLDKQVSAGLLSMADYDKLYKYTGIKKKALNSSLLNLVYDENGVLISSKQTNESKVFPTIMSTVSALTGIAGAIKGASIGDSKDIKTSCVHIDFNLTKKLDSLLNAYSVALKGSYFTPKQFEETMKEEEKQLAVGFEELFYSKEVRMIPLQLTFIIPGEENNIPSAGADKNFDLFSWDKAKQKILLNSTYQQNLMFTPADRFEFGKLNNPVSVKLSSVETAFDKSAAMAPYMGAKPDKITAVYNIPKSERFRLTKPTGSEAYIDTTIKVPQHGKVGFYSMRLSSLELTYDANGELKTMTAESKSAVDTNITSVGTAVKDIITLTKGKTEMDLLKEKADRLELEKKIRDLENSTDQ